jgi:hypothetical protein
MIVKRSKSINCAPPRDLYLHLLHRSLHGPAFWSRRILAMLGIEHIVYRKTGARGEDNQSVTYDYTVGYDVIELLRL